jgi:hypothetical protein
MSDLRAGLALEDAFGDGDIDMIRRLLDLRQGPSAAFMARVRAIPTRSQDGKKRMLRWDWPRHWP